MKRRDETSTWPLESWRSIGAKGNVMRTDSSIGGSGCTMISRGQRRMMTARLRWICSSAPGAVGAGLASVGAVG